MNGSTAKKINRSSNETRVSSRLVKRKYNGLNHFQKTEARQDMIGFCIEVKKARSKAIRRLKSSEKAKRQVVKTDKSVKEKISSRNAIRDLSKKKASKIRAFWAWLMLKIGRWNYEKYHRYKYQLEPRG